MRRRSCWSLVGLGSVEVVLTYRVRLRRMPVGSPVFGSFSTLPGPSGLQSLSMPLSFRASELSEASGPVEKSTGVLGRSTVQLIPGRVALLLKPGDEHLAD